MTRLLTLLLLTCACLQIQAQVNYVRNPSFEQHWRCPNDLDQIKFANYWSPIDTLASSVSDTFGQWSCTPEYCHTCSANTICSAPFNQRFYQYPRTGDGMVQMVMYFDESFAPIYASRDYLQSKLYKLLSSGQSYCITFYVNFEGFFSHIPCGYAVDHIGAYLDDGSIDIDTGISCGIPHPSITPQAYTNSIITDSINWTKIQGSFVATGNERFITIGNFFDIYHTDTIQRVGAGTSGMVYSWYLVDDISVIESDAKAVAGSDVSVAYGDTAWIGVDSNGEGMPCYWYVLGGTGPIDSGGRIGVRPDTTTTYVVMMDLCGNITYDTVMVNVWPVGVNNVQMSNVKVFPNPAQKNFTIQNAQGITLSIYNVLGEKVKQQTCTGNVQEIDISSLHSGVYLLEITDLQSGTRTDQKLFKD